MLLAWSRIGAIVAPAANRLACVAEAAAGTELHGNRRGRFDWCNGHDADRSRARRFLSRTQCGYSRSSAQCRALRRLLQVIHSRKATSTRQYILTCRKKWIVYLLLLSPRLSTSVEPIDWALVTRRSVRAFLPTPVARGDIESILRGLRALSATGVNIQPLACARRTGAKKSRLSAAINEINDDPARSSDLDEPYDYYPREWIAPYLDRRRKVGWNLYGLLGIEKGDKERMHVQHGRNYRFFDAPVGLFFTVDRVMREGSLLDTGMFLQSVMLAARARASTLPASGFQQIPPRDRRRTVDSRQPDAGLRNVALGHADHNCIENSLVTDRVPVGDFTTFYNE